MSGHSYTEDQVVGAVEASITDHYFTKVVPAEDRAERAEALLRRFVNELWPDESCRYDHDGYCQAHALHEGPDCPVAQAVAIAFPELAPAPAPQSEPKGGEVDVHG